jgi:uncharacterized protein
MYNFVIVHGTFGSPFENWFPWLYNQLASLGYSVLVPQLPTPEFQSFDNWARVLDSYIDYFDENTTFIGHSIGASFIVNYILEKKIKLGKFISVSGFYGTIGAANTTIIDELNDSFWCKSEHELMTFKNYVQSTIGYISSNDPYISYKQLAHFTEIIGFDSVQLIPNAGHFNTTGGYNIFPQLLNSIL